jgi:transcriptional regulator with XRE-family HTH domain
MLRNYKSLNEMPYNSTKVNDELYHHKNFGAAIIAVRSLLGVSSKEVARLADISEKQLSEIEDGIVKPDKETLNRLMTSLSRMWFKERFLVALDDWKVSEKRRTEILLNLFATLKK